MDLSQDDVIQILKIMNESSFDELHLKMGDLELAVNKQGSPARLESQEFAPHANTGSPATNKTNRTAADSPAPSNLVQAAEAQEIKRSIEAEIAELKLVPIKSPMLGVFFRAPKPGEPPFVEDGSVVEKNTTLCTIEVMKLFSTIKAGINGRIKRICADDGELVEHGQVLFLVDQDVN
jgi:acetyl-CoA carboxylase biotin carboxyl carrier protein